MEAGSGEAGELPRVRARHIKKKALKNKALSVSFDEKDLRDYVTGFHKRKKKRRKEAQQKLEEAQRRKRIEQRKKRKLEREFAVYGGAPANASVEPDEGDDESEQNGENEPTPLPSVRMASSEAASSRGKKDVGWNHGTLVNPNKPTDGVKCNYCSKITKGGISRLKEHLVGGFRNATACKHVPECVKTELKKLMEAKKRAKFAMVSVPYFDDIVEAEQEYEEELEELPTPSSFQSTAQQSKESKQMGPINWYFKKDDKANKTELQCSTKAPQYVNTQKRLRDEAVQKFAGWMYDVGIPFSAIKYDSFGPMIQAIGQYGAGMKPPTYHEMRVTCLKKEVERTKQLLKGIEEEKAKSGCSLMADSWKDKNGRSLINFLVNTARGSMFVESTNASSYSYTAEKMFELLDRIVQRVGEKNVVQVITNSASVNLAAGKMLMDKYPHLYWSPCAAHCLELMFEDIFKMPNLKRTLEQAITVCGYIYSRAQVLNMMREFTRQKDMIRAAKTRFATAFLTLRNFHKHKLNLRKMFISEEWCKSKFAKEEGGKQVQRIILMPSFWNTIVYCMKFGGPLIEVLRLVEGEKEPPMGYIYEAMDKAKEKIEIVFEKNEVKYREIFDIIDTRWKYQLHHPLHAAGHYLNPKFFYGNPNIEEDAKVMAGLWDCIERLVPLVEVHDEISKELRIYKKAEGNFKFNVAKRQRTLLAPAEWWALFGSSAPNLQNFAITVLSLSCSSYGCERNLSVFEHLHSKKRNKLEQMHSNDLVFIKYNRALLRRYENRDRIDPIVLENHTLDENNEWLLGRMEEKDEDELDEDNLTWGNVADVMGVDQNPYTSKSRNSHSTITSTSSRGRRGRPSTSSRGRRGRPSTFMARLTKRIPSSSAQAFPKSNDKEEFDTNLSDTEEEEEKDNECYSSPGDDKNDDINLDDEDLIDEE